VNATEPMSMDQAIEALIQPETTEEVVEETESQPEADATDEPDDEQPIEDSEDEGEEVEDDDGEPESDDADDEGDEDIEDDVEDDEGEDPAEEFHTVKVDGVEEQVSLEDLKRGYSGQKYVQQGMQKAAEARKQAEDVHAALMQERQSLAQMIQGIQRGALNQPQEPSLEMAQNDPIGYVEAKAKYDADMRIYQQRVEAVNQQLNSQTEAERAAKHAYYVDQAQKLVEAMPDLANPNNMAAFQKEVDEAGSAYGYSEAEMKQISSWRDMKVLSDANKWRKLQEGKKVVAEKSKKARPKLKAGAKKIVNKQDTVRKQRDKLRKSGSLDDALSLILDPNLR
jgi:hypothetical protein